jgi:hypothetical protein
LGEVTFRQLAYHYFLEHNMVGGKDLSHRHSDVWKENYLERDVEMAQIFKLSD